MSLRTRIEAEIGPLTDWVAFRDLLIDVLVEAGYDGVAAPIRSVYGPTMHDDPRAIADLIVLVADVTDSGARDALYSAAHLSNAGAADIYRLLLTVVDTRLQGVGGGATIVLSANSQAENTTIGATIGNLSVVGGTGSWTFTKTADPSSAFTLTGAALKNAIVFNYESATSYSVTIQATNGTDTISATFTVYVTNVLEVTLNDPLTIDNTELIEGSAAGTLVGTISGKTSGSTLTLFDNAGGRVALDGIDIEAGAVAIDLDDYNITVRETHPDAASAVDTVFTISGVSASAPAIAAPTEVTWIDGTNPPWFNMTVQELPPDEVQVGDIPQIRYNGAGTIYSGAAVASFPLELDFSGAGLPTLGAGAGYGQVRFVRDPGGPGEIIGDWSSASEGVFTIAATGLTYAFAGWISNAGVDGASATATLDIGAAAPDRFVLLGVMSDDPAPTLTGVPLSLPLIESGESWGFKAWYGDFVPTGSGSVEMAVTLGANAELRCPVWVIRGSTSLTTKDSEIGTPGTVTVEAEDLVFAMEVYDNPEDWTNSPTEPADNSYSNGLSEFHKGFAAVFVIDAPNAAFSPGMASGREARTALIVLGEA